MQYDNPFAEEVRENPYDDIPRLIFADFLDDSGDPLGQLIRVQIALTNMDRDDVQRTPLEKQEQSLIAQYGEAWLEPLRQFGAEGISTRCFQRGLIERIRISAENFLESADEICLQSPALHTLCLTGLENAFQRFARAQLPRQIRGLDLSPSRLRSMEEAEMNWPMIDCLEQLRELDLRLSKVSDNAIAQLCSRDLSNLQKLDLTACDLTPISGLALAACPTLVNLRSLKLSLNQIGDDGLAAIARSNNFGNLVELDLASNQITNLGANAVAQSSTLVSLQRLNLRANGIRNSQLSDPNNFTHLSRLREVDLRNNG